MSYPTASPPVRLQRLNNVPASNPSPSFDGPVIMVEVNARLGAKELYARLVEADGWPAGLLDIDLRRAAIRWIGLEAWVIDARMLAGPGAENEAPLPVPRTCPLTLVDELNPMASPIVEYLACTVSDLNHLAVWCAENAVDPKYLEQLAQLIGYSVDGYGTLSYVSNESHERAAAQAERLVASREETITDG